MRKHLLAILIGVTLFSCKQTTQKKDDFVAIPKDLIDIPFYSMSQLYFDNSTLVLDLVDSTAFNNPTVFIQALSWYSFQISSMNLDYDSLRINYTMPVRDSIPIVHSNQVNKAFLNKIYENLDNTLFGDFQKKLFALNWKTRTNYMAQQTSILDRINSLFARNIDTSNYKSNFPNNDAWFGTDCIPIFEIYFLECLENKKSIGHEIVGEIDKSTKYFNESDKLELNSLIYSYSEKFKKN